PPISTRALSSDASDFYNRLFHTTFFKPDKTSNEEMNNELITAAEKHHVSLFSIERNIQSTVKSEMTIFGDSAVLNDLKNKGIVFTKNQSLFLGDLKVKNENFAKFQNKERGHDYYLIGEEQNIIKFKQQLINKYGGGFPRIGSFSNADQIVFVFLSVCLLLILFLTFYEIQLLKKEISIRVLMGVNLTHLILKQIVMDIIVLVCIYIICFILTNPLHHSLFLINIQVIAFSCFLFLNSVLYIILLKGDFRKTLSSASGKSVLTLNYGLKVVMSVLSILSITVMSTFIDEGINYYKQKDIISAFKEYSYVELNYRDVNRLVDSAKIREAFHHQFQSKSVEITNIQATVEGYTDFEFNYPVIRMNGGYKAKLPKEIQQRLTGDFVHILIPNRFKKENIPFKGIENAYSFYETPHPPFKVTYYDSDIDVLSVKNMYYAFNTKLEENPIIMYNSTFTAEESSDELAHIRTYIAYDIMYNITEEEYQEFLAAHNFNDELEAKINIKNLYDYNWKIIKRAMYISFILLGLILCMNIFIVMTILKVEYTFNAKELLLKKLLGRSLFERNKKIINLSIGACLLSILISIVISVFIKNPFINYLTLGGIIILLFDCLILYVNITRLEQKNIIKVLKGGVV
ncbi:MAG: DUF1430 domain-containing protein, partial [Bacillus sp. (in: firmicutes)]